MRNKIQDQRPIVYPFISHKHGRELRRISDILDHIPEAATLVYDDLVAHGPDTSTGRPGLTGDQALRLLILKQMNGFSYEGLAFRMADSLCLRAFCGFGIDEKSPRVSTLQENIKRIQPETLELINRLILEAARVAEVEKGRVVRVDCTVVAANIHEPSDSAMLFDCVRVLARQMARVRDEVDTEIVNHTRQAKRRALGILNAKSSKKRGLQVADMAKSKYVYRKLRDFRAGFEGMISFLKRGFGVGRCTWRGLASFKSYVWGSVVSANLLVLARQTME